MDPALAIEVAASSRTQAVNSAMSRGESDIQRFYKNSVVFLTGGTGFLGKQLTEKLFRSCDISKIYFLIRPKKGNSTQQRLNDLLKEPVFDSLRKIQPDFASKIVPVAGDISEINLGISEDVWNTLTEEVNIIFHSGATTKFTETLQVATFVNVRGTREVLALGRACKNLKSFVHVSTTYARDMTINNKEIPEQFITAPISPNALINMAESMSQDRLQRITPALTRDWANTYTFTKTVAEELIRESSAGLPISIVRTAQLICSYSEPSPGWVDESCMYGATGLFLGIGLGVVHTTLVDKKSLLSYFPCDMANNAIIAVGRETATSQAMGGDNTRIYNVSTTNRNPLTWQMFKIVLRETWDKVPSPSSVYYSFSHDTKFKFIYKVLFLFLHIIPAYIVDAVYLLRGKKPRYAKLSKKVYKYSNFFSSFLNTQWTFLDNNLEKLFESLSSDDQIIFNFDVTSIDFREETKLLVVGARKYIIKDELRGTDYAIKKQKFLKVVNYVVMPVYLYGLWKLLYFVGFSLSLSYIYFTSIMTKSVN